jgi:hypothetical protein
MMGWHIGLEKMFVDTIFDKVFGRQFGQQSHIDSLKLLSLILILLLPHYNRKTDG